MIIRYSFWECCLIFDILKLIICLILLFCIQIQINKIKLNSKKEKTKHMSLKLQDNEILIKIKKLINQFKNVYDKSYIWLEKYSFFLYYNI